MTYKQKIEMFRKLKQAQKEFEELGSPINLLKYGTCILNDKWMSYSYSDCLRNFENSTMWGNIMKDANVVHKKYIELT